MKIEEIDGCFSICKVKDYKQINLDSEYCFIGKTNMEKSLVCLTEEVPDHVIARDDGWRAFRVQGILDFSLIGVLSKITEILAQNKIGVFVVSTYDTDYVLIKKENYGRTLKLLSSAGYEIL